MARKRAEYRFFKRKRPKGLPDFCIRFIDQETGKATRTVNTHETNVKRADDCLDE